MSTQANAPRASFRLSASAIQMFLECRQKYLLERMLKVGPAGRQLALDFGAAIDGAVRVLYEKNWDLKAAKETFRMLYKEDASDTKRTYAVGELMIERYVQAYRNQGLEIVSQGFPFVLEVDGFGMPVEIVGEIDRVVRQAGRTMPSEMKTTSQLTADYMKKFWVDVQTGIYLVAAKELIDPAISAVHIDALLVAKSDPSKLKSAPLLRDIVEHDAEELAYMAMRIRQIIGAMIDAITQYESGANDLFYENDQACTNYGGCKYLQYCRRSPKVRASIMQTEFVRYEQDSARFAMFDNARRGKFRVQTGK